MRPPLPSLAPPPATPLSSWEVFCRCAAAPDAPPSPRRECGKTADCHVLAGVCRFPALCTASVTCSGRYDDGAAGAREMPFAGSGSSAPDQAQTGRGGGTSPGPQTSVVALQGGYGCIVTGDRASTPQLGRLLDADRGRSRLARVAIKADRDPTVSAPPVEQAGDGRDVDPGHRFVSNGVLQRTCSAVARRRLCLDDGPAWASASRGVVLALPSLGWTGRRRDAAPRKSPWTRRADRSCSAAPPTPGPT